MRLDLVQMTQDKINASSEFELKSKLLEMGARSISNEWIDAFFKNWKHSPFETEFIPPNEDLADVWAREIEEKEGPGSVTGADDILLVEIARHYYKKQIKAVLEEITEGISKFGDI